MNTAFNSLGAKKSAETLTDKVFQQLYDDILSCRLAPGTKLLQKELRAEFGTAGSAIREALSQLVSLGLVTAEPQRGFCVAQASVEDLLDLTKTRIWVETIALRSAIANGGREWEAGILSASHMLGGEQPLRITEETNAAFGTHPVDEEWRSYHQRYHDALIAGCGFTNLISYRSTLIGFIDRYRKLSSLSQADRDVAAEHREITSAVLERNTTKAVALIETHFLETASRVLAGIDSFKGSVEETIAKLRREISIGEGRAVTLVK
jgi:DNA-binding GntR family transcriptional regulator